jgi:hypothetical protein
MPRSTLTRLIGLCFALTLAACAAYKAQHDAGMAPGHNHPDAGARAGEAPGAEFTELPEAAQLARVRGETEAMKAQLAKTGRYACCVEPPCTECLLKYGECHCRETVRKEGPCCGECTEAWVEGRGAVEGVSAWEILERKKDMLRQNGGGAAPPPQEHNMHHHH